MNAVGIDVAKGKSVVSILRPFGEVISSPFELCHTSRAVDDFIHSLSKLEGEVRIVMEYTGRYHEPVAHWLTDAGFYVSLVNPKLIKDFGNNSLRKVKSDKKDAVKIARYALDNWNDLRQYNLMDKTRDQLKIMNRQFDFYMKHKTALKNNLISLLDQTFPGANTFFTSPVRKDGSQKWVDFVTSFWHVDCVRKGSLTAFTERYQKFCTRKGYDFYPEKAAQIFEASKELIALLPKDKRTKGLIMQAIEQLNTLSRTVEHLRLQMDHTAAQLPEYPIVMAMKGVGPSLGPQLMAEIGDIRRFSHRSALTAFAGVDPGVNQSSSYNQKSVRTSKRGSAQLRKSLFQIMDVLVKTSPETDPVYAFISKKRAEGKPYYVYMTAGANKFLRIYYGRVKEYLASLPEEA
ncbi:IS110 family transposase [Enterococcus sp. DIV0187]|uniref:IS110 family transposase n=1 Tax=Enterococcus sp. DIV0187 TaxID=2774644 RepID=UPI003F27738F